VTHNLSEQRNVVEFTEIDAGQVTVDAQPLVVALLDARKATFIPVSCFGGD
jgi:hypothetical protein